MPRKPISKPKAEPLPNVVECLAEKAYTGLPQPARLFKGDVAELPPEVVEVLVSTGKCRRV